VYRGISKGQRGVGFLVFLFRSWFASFVLKDVFVLRVFGLDFFFDLVAVKWKTGFVSWCVLW